MPTEAEVDPAIAQLETSRFFIRTYNTDGELKSELPLKKYVPVYVGRALGCHIDLVEPSISRRHCVFQHKDLIVDSFGNTVTGYMIYDLKSSHGTFLNETRIPSMENIKLKHGDKVTLGLTKTVFQFWDSKEQEGGSEKEGPVVDETLLAQQPSSTSQAEENRNENDDESWFQKYMKVLDHLKELLKEQGEQEIQIPDHEKRTGLAKKFETQISKLSQQVQASSSLMAEILRNESSSEVASTPKRGRKRKTELPAVDKPPLDEPKVKKKRGRKSRKEIEAEQLQEIPPPTPEKKRPGRPKASEQKLAIEVQKQIQASLRRSTNQDEDPLLAKLGPVSSSDDLFKSTGFEGGDMLLSENNPLSMINGPLFQPHDHESDHSNDPLSSVRLEKRQSSNVTVADQPMREKRTIKRPKWREEDDYVALKPKKETATSVPDPTKKRRGRPPKVVQQIVETNGEDFNPIPLDSTIEQRPSPSLDQPEPVKRKRGRKPNPLKALLVKPMQPTENDASPKRRGRKKKIPDEVPLAHILEEHHQRQSPHLPPPKSPQSELIAVNPIPSNNINGNGNYRPVAVTLTQPVVLLRKLSVQHSSGRSTPNRLPVEF